MNGQALKNSILQMAMQGKLVEQRPEEGTAEELYQQIQEEKQKLISEGKLKKEKPLPDIQEEEIPFDIPKSWKWTRLGDLITLISGCSFKKKEIQDTGIRILRGGNILNGNFMFFDDDVCLDPNLVLKERLLKYSDIIFVASTGSKRVIGKSAFVNRNLPFVSVGAFLRVARSIVSDTGIYLSYIFLSDYFLSHIRHSVKGTNINNIRNSYVTELLVPLPPLKEQQRIVEKLIEGSILIDEYSKLESNREDLDVELPEKLKKSILQYAMQGKLVPQIPSEGTAEELYAQIKEEKQKLIAEGKLKKEKPLPPITEDEIPFQIPKSWMWVRLGNIGNSNIGLTYSPKDISNDGTIILRSCNIKDGHIDLTDIVKVKAPVPDKNLCNKGDILICARNGSKRLVGKAALVNDEGFGFGAFMSVFRSWCNEFMVLVINSDFYRKQLLGDAGTTTINQITQKMLKLSIVPIPPLDEQKRIVIKIDQSLKELA